MRRILLMLAAALALPAFPDALWAAAPQPRTAASPAISVAGFVPADGLALRVASESETGEADADDDDSTVSLSASSEVRTLDRTPVGAVPDDAASIVGRNFRSRPLCRGRPRRDPRGMTPSLSALVSTRLVLDRSPKLPLADPVPRRLSPHPRP